MNKVFGAAAVAAMFALTGFSASAADWKDGVLFGEQQLTEIDNFAVYQIDFGLEPGKCSGQLTTVGEWLNMKEGTLSFAYSDEAKDRKAGDGAWWHESGTQVEVCNKGDVNAIVAGVQFRPKQ